MMTKKDFNAIAEIFRTDKGFYDDAEMMRDLLAREIAAYCQQQNPRFDYARFLKACQIEV